MGNSTRPLLAKLLMDLHQGYFFTEMFFSKIVFTNFSKKIFRRVFEKWLQNQILNKKNIFVIVFLEIRYSFLKNLKLALGIKLVIYYSLSFATIIQKQEENKNY